MSDFYDGPQVGSVQDLIRERVQILGEIFNREVAGVYLGVFQEVLERYPYNVLRKAFIHWERDQEKFPTPNQLRSFCDTEMEINLKLGL